MRMLKQKETSGKRGTTHTAFSKRHECDGEVQSVALAAIHLISSICLRKSCKRVGNVLF